jgi:hypothetical protein
MELLKRIRGRKIKMGILDSPYKPLKSTLNAFCQHLVDPNIRLEHSTETLIAKYIKPDPDGDGQDVLVYCCAMPAEFFIIKAMASTNSLNHLKQPFTLSTGSGMSELSAEIAKAISEGMLGLEEV